MRVSAAQNGDRVRRARSARERRPRARALADEPFSTSTEHNERAREAKQRRAETVKKRKLLKAATGEDVVASQEPGAGAGDAIADGPKEDGGGGGGGNGDVEMQAQEEPAAAPPQPDA